MAEFRRASSDLRSSLNAALEEPPAPPKPEEKKPAPVEAEKPANG
jgi:hypothetical protein